MARRIYFDKKKDAEKELQRRNNGIDNMCLSVRRVPYGRHKGQFVVCSFLGFINEMYDA
jgi:hypothetical protein